MSMKNKNIKRKVVKGGITQMQHIDDNIKYLVEDVDVDGDGIPDGVLVKQYKIDANNNKHFLSQVFVPNKKLENDLHQQVETYKQEHPEIIQHVQEKGNKNYLDPRNNGGLKIVDDKAIARLEDGKQIPQTQHIIVQDETTLAQHVKAGFGISVGFAITDILAGIFQGLFSSGSGE